MLAADFSSAIGQETTPAPETTEFYIPPAFHLSESGEPLTGPTAGAPLDIALSFLQNNADSFGLEFEDLNSYSVTNNYQSSGSGVTHIYLQQTHDGLPLANALININIMPQGQVLNASSTFLPDLTPGVVPTPTISASAAFESLAGNFDWELDSSPEVISAESGPGNRAQETVLAASGISTEDIPAELQFVPTSEGGVELAWKFNVQPVGEDHWFDVSVSATDGSTLLVSDWVNHASYNVYPLPLESPSHGARSIEVDPFDLTASPYGWHDTDGITGPEYSITRGNNVYAYTDHDFDDAPDPNSSPSGGTGLNFDFPIDFSQDPITYSDASVTNLFTMNNYLHDILYAYGFDEASGNFQATNYSGQGLGNDAVNAEAQDGYDLPLLFRNNANFGTPPEGNNPRMQMYLWTSAMPELDGDLDNAIVAHEYGHGVSNRLTGGGANASALQALQSGGMGEGWSDFIALMLTQNSSTTAFDQRGLATYANGDPAGGPGIRSLPYTYDFAVNDHSFSDIVGSTFVHDIGETWASTLWDLNWALIEGNSIDPALSNEGLGYNPDLYSGYPQGGGGNQLALQLVLDGMKLQPANPTFLDARDAILAADVALTGGVNQSTIWTVFARRGMGVSADDGGDADDTNVTEAFDVPPESYITGLKFQDTNENGVQDVGENGVENWTIYLDLDDNGELDVNEPSTLTNNLGQYSFTVTNPGDFVIREVMQDQWTQTFPGGDGAHRVTISDFGVTLAGNDFGNHPEPGELNGSVWSDLNQNAVRDGGERGLADITIFLDLDGDGALDTTEPSTITGIDGSYQFAEVPVGSMTVLQDLPAGMQQTFPTDGGGYDVTLDPGEVISGLNFGNFFAPATVAGFVWNDVNGNGIREGNDLSMKNVLVYLDVNGDSRVSLGEPSERTNEFGRYEFQVPPGDHIIRVAPMLGFTQSFPADGEGYEITTQQDEILINNDFGLRGFSADFGDAPTPYPTRFTNNGAAHEFAPGISLGTVLTAELSGQPSNGADADDDDGVAIVTSVEAGQTATVEVNVTGEGYLNAWIDFDRNGIWSANEEQIIANQQLNSSTTEITFDVPETTVAGTSYARFRFSSEQNLLPTGVAPDGEVEDYVVTLINNLPDPEEEEEPGEDTSGDDGTDGNLIIPDSFTNPVNRYDVDDNGTVNIGDAYLIISQLRANGPRALTPPEIPISHYYDTNHDSRLNLSDALEIVRALILQRLASEAEGEASPALVSESSSQLDESVDLIASDIAIGPKQLLADSL